MYLGKVSLRGSLLFTVLLLVTATPLLASALTWIEDEDRREGAYSWAYAYVGAFVVSEGPFTCKLSNIEHYGSGGSRVDAIIIVDRGVSSDYTDAWTITSSYVDPDKDGKYVLDARAIAYISSDNCVLGR